MAVVRECQICGESKKDAIIVVTTRADEVCWGCVAEAVSYYKDAMKEGE